MKLTSPRQLFLFLLFILFSIPCFSQIPPEPQKKEEDIHPALKNAKMNPADAQPEDWTNENFPGYIESFDFQDADLGDVVKAIGKLTKKNFILDGNLRGKKITIIAPSKITVAEAYKAFLSALALNGYTIVQSGKFLKIRQVRQAMQDSIKTYSGSYFPNTDQVITRIIKLRYINAQEVTKSLGKLKSANGSIEDYSPTNSLIITDFGTNVERIEQILKSLDVPGFEEKLAVIRIRHAKAKQIADMVNKIINKGESSSSRRFRRRSQPQKGGTGNESYSLVVADDRSNSVIVVGNGAGIVKIKTLIGQLDFPLNPNDAGGVYVYYVRHGEAEKIANVINGVAKEIKAQKKSKRGSGSGGSGDDEGFTPPSRRDTSTSKSGGQNLFGGDVKITADKVTNSLIITASKQDYKVVKNLLAKIDIPRDQVYVKAIIMSVDIEDTFDWGINIYKFKDGGENGIAPRIGFNTGSIASVLTPNTDGEALLGFAQGNDVNVNIGGAVTKIKDTLGLVNFFKKNAGGNIISTPQVTATDNEEAKIESTVNQPIGSTQTTTTTGQTTADERADVKIGIELTPFISPDTDSVRLKIKQSTGDFQQVTGGKTATVKRIIETNVIVNNEDTVVLGGLVTERVSNETRKVPILGDIPLLGWLFKGKSIRKNKQSLLVFLTPKIIRNSSDSNEVLEQQLDERLSFIQRNFGGEDPFGLHIDKLPRRGQRTKSLDTLDELEEPAVESF